MRQLLIIYFAGLLIVTLWPARVSSIPFINISEALNFEIDLDSPVLAAEEDLLSYQEQKTNSRSVQLPNLNESVRKPAAQQPQSYRLADYSKNILDIHNSIGVTLKGPLELKQGLALTDENRIEIHREEKGRVIEYGDVNIENGTYAIKLSSLDGHLCARLRGSTHEILGQGCFALDQVKRQNKSAKSGPMLSVSKYQDVIALSKSNKEIELAANDLPSQPLPREKTKAPTTHKTTYQIYDYYDYNNPDPKPVADLSVANSVDGQEDAESTLVTSISSPGYVPVRVVTNSNTPKRGVAIHRKSTQLAAYNIARDAGFAALSGVQSGTIWGRAAKDGQPIAGADVMIEGRDDVRPLYLNEFYIPDPNQRVTASHGIYTFMGVPDGEYALRAQVGNQFLGFQNASVRSGTMAVADIDSTIRKKNVRISLYDLVSKVSQPAVVTLQNYEEDLVIDDGHADVQVQDTEEIVFGIVNPLNRNYLTAQYSMKSEDELYNFPLIEKDWLESLLVQARLNQAIKSKIVLGIGAPEPYRVTALGSESAQVIYFDSNGQIIEGSYGQAGGGFLILDPEDHVVEYAIQSATQKNVRVHYMPSQVGVVSVIQMY